MKKLIFVLSLFLFASSVSGAVTGLTFITEPQAIATGSISEKLTVSSGEVVGETGDLSLTSSSPTGEFSSSNTNWQAVTKVTWNSTWSNRSFYYRDSSAGSPTITATLTTRTSNQTWSGTQVITIGSGNNTQAETSGTGNAVSGDNSGSGESGSLSAHTEPTTLSAFSSQAELNVSAGRKRVAPVGVPLEFRSKVSGSSKSNDYLEIWWSFGDGTMVAGTTVLHTYQLPGVYQVVVNARQGESRATSRTTVEITKPSVSLVSASPEFVELSNKDRQEINLGGWQLKTAGKSFSFPSDTIIAGGASLKLASSVSRLGAANLNNLALYSPDGQMVAGPRPELTQAIDQLASVVLAPRRVQPASSAPSAVATQSPVVVTPAPVISSTVTLTNPPKKSWWQRIFSR